MKSVNIVIKNSIRIFMKNGLLWTKKKKGVSFKTIAGCDICKRLGKMENNQILDLKMYLGSCVTAVKGRLTGSESRWFVKEIWLEVQVNFPPSPQKDKNLSKHRSKKEKENI